MHYEGLYTWTMYHSGTSMYSAVRKMPPRTQFGIDEWIERRETDGVEAIMIGGPL